MSVRKEWKGWRVDVNWRVPGSTTVQRHRRVLRTRREAEAYERQVRNVLAEGRFGLEKKRAPTLAEYEGPFMEASRAKGNKPRSLNAKETILRRLVRELGAIPLDAPDMRARVGDYQARMLADGFSAKTVKNDMAALEALLNLAADRGVIANVPRLPKVRPPKPRAELLSAEEASQVIAATPSGWRRTWVLVLLRTGIRLGEGLALKWSDVDLTTGSLRIRATRWRGLEGTPKGGRERTVPLSDDARAALTAHRHLRGRYVFCHDDGSPFTDWDVREVVPKACQAAGIGRRVTNHALRHTVGTVLGEHVNAFKVQAFLGHADLSTTRRYVRDTADGLREAARVLELASPQVTAT